MATERLKDFPPLASPAAADIVYVGDASDSDNEVQVTIEDFIGVYPVLLSMGGATLSANQYYYGTATNTVGTATITSYGRSLVAASDANAAQILLNLAIGTNVQAWSAALDSISSLTTAADKMIYTTAANTYAVTDLTSFARTLLDDSDAATAAATLQVLPLNGGTMTGNINMNSLYRLTNVPNPVAPGDCVNKAYVDAGSYLPLSGGTMSGIINMGSNKITNVTDPTNPQDAATLAYVSSQLGNYLPKAGGTMDSTTGVINMNSSKITGLATCTNANDAANKAYVDSVATGLSVQGACYAASTANLTATYANGSSGIGATLTNSGALAAFSIDGVSPPVNSRILVKDQSTTYENGIYTLTTVGSGAVAWVLTRATDYDQTTEIQPGDLVVINNGTSYGGTSFIETATVTAIGTDPILFSQFTFSATAVLLKANNLSDVASTTTAFGNISPLTTKGDILTYSTLNARLGVGSNGQLLQAKSSTSTGLVWTTATYPETTTINEILYSSSNNTVAGITAVNGGVLISSNTGVPSMLANPSAASRMLFSANAAAPTWSTYAMPTSPSTSGKILKSDGTNLVMSTETYATPGASGNVMTSDGTNWTSAAPAGSTPVANLLCQGRLTTSSGNPVTKTDQTSIGTVYWTPFKGNQISLYVSSVWTTRTFTQITISVPATTNTIYDVFLYDSGGTVTSELVAWSSDTARATALAYQDGVLVKSGDATRRWVASFRTTSVSGNTEDSKTKRLVYNYYNRVQKPLNVNDSTSSWNYSTSTWRYANNSSSNRVEVLQGVVEDQVIVNGTVIWSEGGATLRTGVPGIGINVSNANSAIICSTRSGSNGTDACTCSFGWTGYLAEGFNYIAWLEYGAGAGTQTWYSGAAGSNTRSCGLTGYTLC